MNKLNIFISLFVLAFLFACEETEFEKTEDNLGRYVAFSSSTISFAENSSSTTADGESIKGSNAQTVEVFRSTSDLSNSVTVSVSSSVIYTSTTDFAQEGEDASGTVTFSTDLNSVVIPAGKASTSFVVTAFDDDFSSGNKQITLTITNVSDGSMKIGAQGIGGTAIITVIDDDCPIDIASFEGTYSMSVEGSPGAPFEGFDLCASSSRDCSGPVTLTADPTDPLGQTAIITHPSIGGEYKIQFITCPKQTQVVQPMTSFFGVSSWQMQQGSEPGTYNEDTKDIGIRGVLGVNGDFTINLKKN